MLEVCCHKGTVRSENRKFQGVSFPFSDMSLEIKLANLLYGNAWKIDQGTFTPEDCAMVSFTVQRCWQELLTRQFRQLEEWVNGRPSSGENMERSRVERIWDGTSEIQRQSFHGTTAPAWAEKSTLKYI
ncbi:MAG: hypothetical protein CM1200mP30_10710 [Pseudomonadota bacterium]|nr:MAG: hypothetical protein CM1200mP30_10710 [Pseudomonadota bacterium]